MEYQQPDGYDQFAPGRDVAKPRTGTANPLQNAIVGEPTPQALPSRYPVDRSMQQWRERRPGQQQNRLRPTAPPQQFQPPQNSAAQGGIAPPAQQPSQQSAQQIAQGMMAGMAPTWDNVGKIIDALNAQGIFAERATRAGKGMAGDKLSDDKFVYGPNRMMVDTVKDVNGPNAEWSWQNMGTKEQQDAAARAKGAMRPSPLMGSVMGLGGSFSNGMAAPQADQQSFETLLQQLLALQGR